MVRVAVAKHEASLAIGRIPVHDASRQTASHLTHQALRHVDSMMKCRALKASASKDPASGIGRQHGRLQVTTEDGIGELLAGKVAAGKETERSSERVFADLDPVECVRGEVLEADLLGQTGSQLGLFRREERGIAVDLQAQTLEDSPAWLEAVAAEVRLRPPSSKSFEAPVGSSFTGLTGREDSIAQEHLHVRASQRQRQGQQALQCRPGPVAAEACRQEHLRTISSLLKGTLPLLRVALKDLPPAGIGYRLRSVPLHRPAEGSRLPEDFAHTKILCRRGKSRQWIYSPRP